MWNTQNPTFLPFPKIWALEEFTPEASPKVDWVLLG